jgi:hypothetical protein
MLYHGAWRSAPVGRVTGRRNNNRRVVLCLFVMLGSVIEPRCPSHQIYKLIHIYALCLCIFMNVDASNARHYIMHRHRNIYITGACMHHTILSILQRCILELNFVFFHTHTHKIPLDLLFWCRSYSCMELYI